MKKILVFCIITISNCQVYSQKPGTTPNNPKPNIKSAMVRQVFAFDDKTQKYVKQTPSANNTTQNQRFFVPSHENNWVLSTSKSAAHWERSRDTDKALFKSVAKFYFIKISTKAHQSFPYFKDAQGNLKTKGYRRYSITNVKENLQYLGKEKIQNEGLSGMANKVNVFYFQKIEPSVISFNTNEEFILVTDTLLLPTSAPLKNVFLGVKPMDGNKNLPFGSPLPTVLPLNVKIIAGTVLVQGITGVSFPEGGLFQISSNNILLKTPFDKIIKSQLSDLPLALCSDKTKNNQVFVNSITQNDQVLLNRLYLEQLKLINDLSVNATQDPWLKDKVLEKFQTIRFQKIKHDALSQDNLASSNFSRQCEKFDKNFQGYSFSRKRNYNNITILCDGKINEMPIRPIKYYTLPTQARILPVQNDTSQFIGHIKYDPKLNKVNKIELEVELGQKEEEFSRIQSDLAKKGIKIEKNLPVTLLRIEEQALKINGKTIGKIYPVTNNIIKLEIDIIEDGQTILNLFPKAQNVSFDVESTFLDDGSKSATTVYLTLPPVLLKNLDYSDPIQSFDIYENSELTHQIQLVNNLFSTDKNAENAESYGPLSYLEVMVEIGFSNQSVVRGPYKLSSYNTQASNTLVPFLKREPNFTLTINGRALYESGIRNIVPFSINSDIVSIDESMLK